MFRAGLEDDEHRSSPAPTVGPRQPAQCLLGVWMGSTLGMVAADAVAIVAGRVFGKRLPDRAIRIGAAAIFFGFGLWALAGALIRPG